MKKKTVAPLNTEWKTIKVPVDVHHQAQSLLIELTGLGTKQLPEAWRSMLANDAPLGLGSVLGIGVQALRAKVAELTAQPNPPSPRLYQSFGYFGTPRSMGGLVLPEPYALHEADTFSIGEGRQRPRHLIRAEEWRPVLGKPAPTIAVQLSERPAESDVLSLERDGHGISFWFGSARDAVLDPAFSFAYENAGLPKPPPGDSKPVYWLYLVNAVALPGTKPWNPR